MLIFLVPAYQQREREIRRLEAEVEARDKVLGDLQKQLMAAEKLITKMVFQVWHKIWLYFMIECSSFFIQLKRIESWKVRYKGMDFKFEAEIFQKKFQR